MSVPRPGWAEQHPSDWWQGAVSAVRAACDQVLRQVQEVRLIILGVRAACDQAGVREVSSIGLSGQMHSSVLGLTGQTAY